MREPEGLYVVERKKINGFKEYLVWYGMECLGVFYSRRYALRSYKRIKRKLDAGVRVTTETIIVK